MDPNIFLNYLAAAVAFQQQQLAQLTQQLGAGPVPAWGSSPWIANQQLQNGAYQFNMAAQTFNRMHELNERTFQQMDASNQRIAQGWVNVLGGRDPITGFPLDRPMWW